MSRKALMVKFFLSKDATLQLAPWTKRINTRVFLRILEKFSKQLFGNIFVNIYLRFRDNKNTTEVQRPKRCIVEWSVVCSSYKTSVIFVDLGQICRFKSFGICFHYLSFLSLKIHLSQDNWIRGRQVLLPPTSEIRWCLQGNNYYRELASACGWWLDLNLEPLLS